MEYSYDILYLARMYYRRRGIETFYQRIRVKGKKDEQ